MMMLVLKMMMIKKNDIWYQNQQPYVTTITEHATNIWYKFVHKKYKQRLSNELNDKTFVGVGASNSKDEFNTNRVLYLLI
jgi:hypothetical protein